MKDELFEQLTNISKAHAYDIVSKQVGELKEIIRQLIDLGDLNDLEFTTPEDTEAFKTILNKAKTATL